MGALARSRRGLWAAALAGVLLTPAEPCARPRCTCIPAPGPEVARHHSAAVFLGTVLSVRDSLVTLDREGAGSPVQFAVRRAELRVESVWKGELDAGAPVVVTTGSGGGDCGFPFQRGATYLVYADGDPDALTTSSCSRTAPEAAAGADLRALGSPVAGRHR